MERGSFDLRERYLVLDDGPEARPIDVGPDFWSTIGARDDLDGGRLMTAFHMSEDWRHWEMHPAGDEVLFVASGMLTLVLMEAGGHRTVELRAQETFVVPRGVWHTARVGEAAFLVAITRGAGTRHRPLAEGDAFDKGR